MKDTTNIPVPNKMHRELKSEAALAGEDLNKYVAKILKNRKVKK